MTKMRVKNWEYPEDMAETDGPEEPMDDCGGRCGNSERCARRKSYYRSDEAGDTQGNLIYLLLTLPFNFMISCYTVVGQNYVDPSSGDVSGGMWALGSPVAIEMM